MPYSRPYAGGFVDYPSTTTPINSTALNTMDVGIKTANDQFQTVTTAQRTALTPTVGQCVWDSDLRQLMVFMNASGGNAWQPIGNAIVCTSTTRPATPFEGQVIRETDTNKEFTYSGAAWVQTNTWGTTSGVTGVSNLIVPPSVGLKMTTSPGYTSATAITWSANDGWDTDSMWTSGTNVNINTAGLYVVMFAGRVTGTTTVNHAWSQIAGSGGVTIQGSTNVAAGTDVRWATTAVMNLAASTTLQFSVQVNGGGTLTLDGTSIITRASVTWIGRTS